MDVSIAHGEQGQAGEGQSRESQGAATSRAQTCQSASADPPNQASEGASKGASEGVSEGLHLARANGGDFRGARPALPARRVRPPSPKRLPASRRHHSFGAVYRRTSEQGDAGTVSEVSGAAGPCRPATRNA